MSDEIKQRIVYILTRKDKADDDDTDIYVGSTSQPLEQRFYEHMYNAKNFMKRGFRENNRLYARMNDIGLGDWEVLPLLSRTCDIETICEVERKWIRILGADLNSNLPVREEETRKEYEVAYYEKNKETLSQKQAAYRENNRDLVRQRALNSQMKNIENKKYYCDVCNIACRDNYALKKHLDSYKHFEKRMWDID